MGFKTEQRITGAWCDGCQKQIIGEVIRARDEDQLVRTYCNWRCAAKNIATMVDVTIDDPILLSTYMKDEK